MRNFARRRNQWQHNLDTCRLRPVDIVHRAEQCAQLHGVDFRRRHRKPAAAEPEHRVCLVQSANAVAHFVCTHLQQLRQFLQRVFGRRQKFV